MVGLLIPSLRQPRRLLMIGSTPCHVGLHIALWGASHPRRGNLGIPSLPVPHAIVVACTWHSLLPCAKSCDEPCALVEAASAPSHGRCRAASSWLSCRMARLLIPSMRQPQRLLMVGSTPCHVGLHMALWGASHPRRGNLGIPSWPVPHAIVVSCTWHSLLPCAKSCVVPCSLVEAASAPSHGRCRAASSWLSCRMVGLLIPSMRQPRRLLSMVGRTACHVSLHIALWGASHPHRGNLGIPSWQVPHAIAVAGTWHSLLPCAKSCDEPCALVEAASAPSHGRCRAASSWLSCRIVGLLILSMRQPQRLLMVGSTPCHVGLHMALWSASQPRRGHLGIPS